MQFSVLIVSAFQDTICNRNTKRLGYYYCHTETVLAKLNGAQKRGQLANVYFHCTANCVKLMQPAFTPFLVAIPSGLHPYLQASHRQHIAKELQIGPNKIVFLSVC